MESTKAQPVKALVVVGWFPWTQLDEAQKGQVQGMEQVLHVSVHNSGSFQPATLPEEVHGDLGISHLVFWGGTYPRFGDYPDNDAFRDARPGLVVQKLEGDFDGLVAYLDGL